MKGKHKTYLNTSVQEIDTSANLEITSRSLIEGFEIGVRPEEFL
jgi:hypothetical protein